MAHEPSLINIERNVISDELLFTVTTLGGDKIRSYRSFRHALNDHPRAVVPAGAVSEIVEDALRKTGRI